MPNNNLVKNLKDLVKECQFSHLQKKSNNVKHIETKNEIRQLSGWSDISNVRK